MMNRYARLVSTGSYLPEIEISNDLLRQRFAKPGQAAEDNVISKFERSTGILKRWYAPEDWAASDLALRAAQQALARAERTPEDIDLILLGTDTPDFLTPATSVVLQHKLGATNAGTFDIGCACASFPTGLATAAGWIAANASIRTILVVGVYMMHKLADPNDPMIFFYGDGAGAAVLEPSSEPGFVTAAAQADGRYHPQWGIYSGGTAEPASHEAIDAGRTQVRMLERYPPEVNHEGWPRLARTLAKQGHFELADVDLFIFTQVRKPSIALVMEDLGQPVERAHTVMEEWGYTGSACLGMALDDALSKGLAGPDSLVMLVGSGVGVNQAGAVFRLDQALCSAQPKENAR